jgi:uncharacterized membrane protein
MDGAFTDRQPNAVDAGRGLAWWTDAWPLFTRAAVMWIVLLLIAVVICVAVSVVPIIGPLASSLIGPVFGGGLMLAARKVDHGSALDVGDLFTGFRDKLSPLLVLGALLVAVSLAVTLIAVVFGVGAVTAVLVGGMADRPAAVLATLGTAAIGFLVLLLVLLPVAMAFLFAPALVALRDVPPVAALKSSFFACLRNIVPMLVYGVIYILAAVVASIPFGLGWIVLLPLLVLTAYTAYRDIYER